MMDEEIRQAVSEVREMKQMCGNINMKLTNIVTQRGQDWKKKLEAEYQRGLEEGKKATYELVADASGAEYQKGFEDGKAVNDKGCEGCRFTVMGSDTTICAQCCNAYHNRWTAKADKIEVGDEVNWLGTCFIVTRIFQPHNMKEQCDGIDDDGCVYSYVLMDDLEKTGRHFDIAKILEAMKHD